jgi:hypothetical protein
MRRDTPEVQSVLSTLGFRTPRHVGTGMVHRTVLHEEFPSQSLPGGALSTAEHVCSRYQGQLLLP